MAKKKRNREFYPKRDESIIAPVDSESTIEDNSIEENEGIIEVNKEDNSVVETPVEESKETPKKETPKEKKKSRLEVLADYYVKAVKDKLPANTCVSYQRAILREINSGYVNGKYSKEDLLTLISDRDVLQGQMSQSFNFQWPDTSRDEKDAYFTLMSILNISLMDRTAPMNRAYVSANFRGNYNALGDQLLRDFL